jgi:hypothetical protein
MPNAPTLCAEAAAIEILGGGDASVSLGRRGSRVADIAIFSDDDIDTLSFAIAIAKAAKASAASAEARKSLLTDGPFPGGLFLSTYNSVVDAKSDRELARIYCSKAQLAPEECG